MHRSELENRSARFKDLIPDVVYQKFDQLTKGRGREIVAQHLKRFGVNSLNGELLGLPHTHGSESDAVYLGDEMAGYNRVLLAVQDRGGRTSLHLHLPPMQEIYIRIGNGEFYVNELAREQDMVVGRKRSLLRDFYIVEPGVPHFGDTEGSSDSAILIIMTNAGKIPHEQHHLPLIGRLTRDSDPRIIRSRDITADIPLIAV